jgi:uroporphyrinogen-III decarboxylase
MTHRERFFRVLEGEPVDRAPFFPDITTWYQASRLGVGTEQPYSPGQYIPDDSLLHGRESRASGRFAGFTFLDFYRELGWGLPVHMYDWYEERYHGGVEKHVETQGDPPRHRTGTWHTPRGELVRSYKLDAEGTWAEYGHMVRSLEELEIVRSIVGHTEMVPRFERVERFLEETDGFGVCDIVLFRSPFGKLVHEYMGFEAVTYALHDHEAEVLEFLAFQEQFDLAFLELAVRAPARIVIISDHADENLISPPWYRRFCIPYYQKACALIHRAGKLASTHLDGNFKGYLPFIGESGFDLLDGCTPAPMFNYEVEELAAALTAARRPGAPVGGAGPMRCYCGVPASLFTTTLPPGGIAAFGRRIVRGFGGQVIVNVGDILPPTGDIERVVALGEAVAVAGADIPGDLPLSGVETIS